MARVAVLVPDLLFGSNVLGALRAAGHEAELCGDPDSARRRAPGSQVLVLDLTLDVPERIAWLRELRAAGALDGVRVLAFYSHVDVTARDAAAKAGVDLVVPRSRLAREGAALVGRLAPG